MKLVFVALSFAVVGSAQAIALFTPDTFTNGGVAGWQGGALQTVTAGGPGGVGDNYLQVETTPNTQPNLAVFNLDSQWLGNYSAVGVTGIRVWLKNLSSSELSMRLVLFDDTDTRWTSTAATLIQSGSAWSQYTFSIKSNDLTRVRGANDYATSMSNITRILFRHQVGTPTSGGTNFQGAFGMDNVEAVPEPATLAALALGLTAVVRRRRSR